MTKQSADKPQADKPQAANKPQTTHKPKAVEKQTADKSKTVEKQRSIEKQLLDLETQYWQALKDRDFAAVLALTDDPCIVAGAQGVASIGRKEFQAMLSSEYRLNAFELSGVQVHMLGDNVAVLAYQVHEELTVDGEDLTLKAADASTWVNRNGRWLCALHTESLRGDPFGRDRTIG